MKTCNEGSPGSRLTGMTTTGPDKSATARFAAPIIVVVAGGLILMFLGWVADSVMELKVSSRDWDHAKNAVTAFEQRAPTWIDGDQARAIVHETVRYPWLEDKPVVMKALTDGSGELKQLVQTVDAIRTEQIEQRGQTKQQRDDLVEIKDLLKKGQ